MKKFFGFIFALGLIATLCHAQGTPAEGDLRPLSRYAVEADLGLGGVGFDVATPVYSHINARVGMSFFDYSTSFTESGTNVNAALTLRAAHLAGDYFPFHRSAFHVSPMVVFANNTGIQANALIPGGTSLTLNGQTFNSSTSNPLQGSGGVSFRRVAPGITVGYGNLLPPSRRKRFSFPVDLGFYYVGQPGLNVNFAGEACDSTGANCLPVTSNASFQTALNGFIARNNHNLSYASLMPYLSFGVGYAF
jgi:hypothetical protein